MNYSKEELNRLYKMTFTYPNGEISTNEWTLNCLISDSVPHIEKIAALKTGQSLPYTPSHTDEWTLVIEATDEVYDWEEDERETERDRRTQAMEMAHNCESFNDYMGY
tara:strand:- start:2 stop:325 length:324 start_codon:yes stop_codon:yes gene_type:complete